MHRRDLLKLVPGAAAAVVLHRAPASGAPTGWPRTDRLPAPTASLVTRWRSDPFSRGSYSFLAVGSSPRDRRALTVPAGDRLFLAGEHTHVDAPAMTHGAYLSGVRAADQVIRALDGDRTHPVVVVGAGMAGLAAARRLRRADVPAIVLEARDRIGGRTFTDDSLGTPVDAGAAWIHGIHSNPMTSLVRTAGETWHTSDPDNYATFDATGRRLSRGELDDVWRRVRRAIRAVRESWPLSEDSSVASWVRRSIADVPEPQRTLAELEIRRTIEHEFGGSLGRLSAWWYDEGENIDGPEVLLRHGYGPVVDHLARGLDIRKKVEVERVEHGRNGAIIRTSHGSVNSSAVISTLPLGVMKHGGPVFDPPLPRRQRTAIGRLGVAHLEKVVLRFPTRFWPDVDYLGVTRVDGLFIEWVPLHRVVGQPVIVAFTAADETARLVDLDDAEIVRQAVATLHAALAG